MLIRRFRETGASGVIGVYLTYFALSAFIIWIFEPSIPRFSDSLWYCFSVATTVGFGDFAAVGAAGRIVTVILSLYSIAVAAICTAVITGFFIDVIQHDAGESAGNFLYDLEHLQDLSKEELAAVSARVKKFRNEKY